MKSQEKCDYYRNRHSCFLLQYHLVVVTKYRRKVLLEPIASKLVKLSYMSMEERWGCRIREINTDKDHVHILFDAPPQIKLSSLVNNYKTVTSRLLRKEYKTVLSKYLWKGQFWSDSYFICSVSDHNTAIVQKYILNQGG